jgi:TfoX/Sxy family transcriptional regulator of competence genes
VAYDTHLADRIRSVLKRAGEFSEKKMFGGLAFMVNGHMCCGVLKTDLVLRLTQEEAAASLRQPHTRPMDFTGKPMKSMIYVDTVGTDSDQALATWVESAVRLAWSVQGNEGASPAGSARHAISSGVDARGSPISKPASKRAQRTGKQASQR